MLRIHWMKTVIQIELGWNHQQFVLSFIVPPKHQSGLQQTNQTIVQHATLRFYYKRQLIRIHAVQLMQLSGHERVGVCLHLRLVMGCEGTQAVLNRYPPTALLANLAFVALAGVANEVSAFIGAHPLPFNLLITNPATELPLQLLENNRPQFLKDEFMVAARTRDHIRLFFHLINVIRSVVERPEGSLDIIILSGIEFIYPDRFDLLHHDRHNLLSLRRPLHKFFPVGDLHETIILLESLQFLHLAFQLLLFFLVLHSFLSTIYLRVLLSYPLLLLDHKLDDAGAAEHVTLVAAGRLDQSVVADGAHLEGFDGVLTNAALMSAVYGFQFLTLLVGEDRGGGVVFGVFAHNIKRVFTIIIWERQQCIIAIQQIVHPIKRKRILLQKQRIPKIPKLQLSQQCNLEDYLKIVIFYMQNSSPKHLLLNYKATNTTNSSVNTTAQCYKSPTSNQYYVVSAINPNRPASPKIHLKTKIRLVSPQRHLHNYALLPKQNHPPREAQLKYYKPISNPSQIENRGRSLQATSPQKIQTNPSNTIQFINRNHNTSEHVNSSINISLQHPTPFFQTKQHSNTIHFFRPVSPQKVFINNKLFNISAIKQKIVYVNPQLQKIKDKKIGKAESSSSQPNIHSQEKKGSTDHSVIPQESNIESIRQQYDVDIKEIQQLQSEIQQNSQEIKLLLQNSRASKHSSKKNRQSKKDINLQNADRNYVNTHSQTDLSIKRGIQNVAGCQETPDPTRIVGDKKETICSNQTLINQLDFTTRHRENHNRQQSVKKDKDEASVQTDSNDNSITHESASTKTDSKFNKLTLTQNVEYSIKIQNSVFLNLQMQENTAIAVLSSTRLKQSVACNKKEERKDLNLCSQPSLDFLFKNQTNRSERQQQKVKEQIIEKSNSSNQSIINNSMQKSTHKSIREISEKESKEEEYRLRTQIAKGQKEIKTDDISRRPVSRKDLTTIHPIQQTQIVHAQAQTSLPTPKGKSRRFTNKMYL